MSKFYLQHPEDDQLLAFADGELSGLSATRVRRHLKDCWRCRTQLEDLQSTVTGFMRYKESVLEAHLPEPPMSWRNMKVEFERIDRTVPPPRFSDRMVARYGMPAVRVASVAAVMAISGLAYFGLRPMFDGGLPAAPVANAPAAPSAAGSGSDVPPVPVQQQPARRTNESAPDKAGQPRYNSEVRVAVALHKLGADLGEPIEFSADSNSGKVTVTATALTANRREQLSQALRGVDAVELKFTDGRPTSGPTKASAPVEGGRLPWQNDLEQVLGGKTQVENFGNTVLDLSDAVVARAHALRKLDERFAAAVLDPGDRALVDAIVAEHRTEMVKASAELKRKLAPVLAKLGSGISTSAKWPMLTAAQQTDQWLNVLFAGAATDRSLEQAAAELGRALGSLE